MKKTVLFLLTLCLLLSVAAVPALAVSAPFSLSANGSKPADISLSVLESFTQDNWMTYENVPLYLVTVPAGTKEVTLTDFEQGSVLCYNYSTDGFYLAGVYDDAQIGGDSAIRKLDCDRDGVSDYLAVQTPYSADWETELLYLISFRMEDFTDVKEGAWYTPEVRKVSMMGIMSGMGDGTFSPQSNVSRAMMTAILYHLAGDPKVSSASPFADVTENDWFYSAVCWAAENGFVEGKSAVSFDPNGNVTREEAVTLLWRYAGKAESTQDLSAYTDASQLHGWSFAAVRWAVENGLVMGRTATTLVPAITMTRAEAAALMVRFAGLC